MEVRWKIGKKPRGRWRTPFRFDVKIDANEEIRPHLTFRKEYALPATIYAGSMAIKEGRSRGKQTHCKYIQTIQIAIDIEADTEVVECSAIRTFFGCSSSCSNCQVCLPWRPGKPDYSDFEQIFRQIATDLTEAWNKAVEEAASSEEYEGEEVIITSDPLMKRKEEETLIEKPSRKLRIA